MKLDFTSNNFLEMCLQNHDQQFSRDISSELQQILCRLACTDIFLTCSYFIKDRDNMVFGILIGIFAGVLAVKGVGDIVNASTAHYAPVYNTIGRSSPLMEKKIQTVEVRYCHLTGPVRNALLTAVARLSFTTTQAAHHHFVILTLESGEYIYIDMHAYRNIMVRKNKDGKNGDGSEWLSSECLNRLEISKYRDVTLANIIRYVEQDSDGEYELIHNNCQHFAKRLFNWI